MSNFTLDSVHWSSAAASVIGVAAAVALEAETWHRYEDVRYAPSCDEFGESRGHGQLRVEHRIYKVVKETPCGVRLDNGRFVNRTSRKMWACPTEKAAMESFIARKTRQASILQSQLDDVEMTIRLAEEIDK